MSQPRPLYALLTLSLLTGCVNQEQLTKTQCAQIQWREQGYQYGLAGRPVSDLTALASECQQVGVAADTQAFQQGYQRAFQQECTVAKAFQLGSRGEPIPPTCPPALAPEFYTAWDNGVRTYCVPEIGFELGRSGGNYNPICPDTLSLAFKSAYAEGHAVFEHIQQLRNQAKALRAQLNEVQQLLVRNQSQASALQQRTPNHRDLPAIQQRQLFLENQKQALEAQLLEMQGEITRSEVEK